MIGTSNATPLTPYDTLNAGDNFGASVAVRKTQSTYQYVVAAPGKGKIYVFSQNASNNWVSTYCLSGAAPFGSAILASDVDGDGNDDLLVSAGSL